ncbi:MAG: hypothetical protein NVS2B3_14110 [Vulcanimicrobiaceae bacterium]
MVEFALAGTLALTLIFGTIEFGRALFAYDQIGQAARLGTRYAIVHAASCDPGAPVPGNPTTCVAAIHDYILLKSGLDTAPVVTWQDASGATCYAPGCVVTVSLSAPFAFVALPIAAQTLTSSSQLVISQ